MWDTLAMLERCPACQYGPIKDAARYCMRCGHVFPERVEAARLAKASPARVSRDARLKEFRDVPCGACGRVCHLRVEAILTRHASGQTGCQTCGGPLQFPSDVLAQAGELLPEAKTGPVRLPCPCCDKVLANQPLHGAPLVRCGFCGTRFPPVTRLGDEPRLGPDGDAPLATEADAARECANLPDTGLGPLLKGVLQGRARHGELVVGEAARVCALLERLLAWAPQGDAWLPLLQTEALELVPHALFRTVRFFVDHAGHTPELVITVGQEQSTQSIPSRAAARDVLVSQAVSMGALAFGVGGLPPVHRRETEDVVTYEQSRVRVAVEPAANGVLLSFSLQLNNEPPRPLSRPDAALVPRWLATRRASLVGYATLQAVLGPLAGGLSPFLAQPSAIARRVAHLWPAGASQAALAGQQLSLLSLAEERFPAMP